jgi:hypothetical protein
MPLPSRVQKTILGQTLEHYGKQDRGAPPVSFPFVSRPRSAHLAAEGTLSWKWYSNAVFHGQDISVAVRARRISVRLGERFAALADKPDEAICCFAGQWGPLRYSTAPTVRNGYTESIEEWRRFAILARALLRCAVALSTEAQGRPVDWVSICEWLVLPATPAPTAEHGLLLLALALNQWYGRSTGNSIVELQGKKIVMRPRSVSLFGIIGLQLAYTATATRDSLVCYHCGGFYTPSNKPRTGSRNFCPRCRRQAKPQLYAMRDLRARQKRNDGT